MHEKQIMKFPYGISDFNAIRTEGYFYQDRTGRIPLIENAGKYLLFIRPRRFGKSLWLSTLRHYYDIAQEARFGTLFGGLAIAGDPTPLKNRYFVFQWDFSCVDPTGSAADIRRSLHDHINTRIRGFSVYYDTWIDSEIPINPDNALDSLGSLLHATRRAGHPVYLFIDEYDNFANEVMSGIRDEEETYKALVHEKGPLKTLFKAVKSAAGEGTIDRIFITGVSPVVMSDITSGFNIAKDIYLKADFNDLCGFTEPEFEAMVKATVDEAGLDGSVTASALSLARTYYNGYTFAPEVTQRLYNPTMVLHFLDTLLESGAFPREMLDANLSMDEAKLSFVGSLPGGRQLLLDIVREAEPVMVSGISNRFGISRILSDVAKTHDFLVSFLYYVGVLSIRGISSSGKLEMRVPNLITRGLYVTRIAESLLPDPRVRDDGRSAAERVLTEGDIGPLCDFVEGRYFQVFHNPDYKWANELTVKTAFLTLLYDDIRYIMDSEHETGRGYADLTMIIRPDMRKYQLLDLLFEFKYVKLSQAGVTVETARRMSAAEVRALPAMRARMAEAVEQARRYGAELERKHGPLRLRAFAVVSLGFERLWAEPVADLTGTRRS